MTSSATSPLVLVVDDETLIAELLKDALEHGGYRVLVAYSAEDAAARLRSEQRNVGALVTDVNLGKGRMNGWELARAARAIRPAIPMIYVTGDSAHQWAAHGVPNSVLVTKPFVSAQVVDAVSQLLRVGIQTR